jgi:hypothetical protein
MADPLNIWIELEVKYPNISVEWDIQGGPEWLGNRAGPRVADNQILPKVIRIYVGNSSAFPTKIVDDWGYIVDDWGYADYHLDTKKWRFFIRDYTGILVPYDKK